MPFSDDFSYQELEQIFGADLLNKAILNLHNVENLTMDGETTRATVRDPQNMVYRVLARPLRERGVVTGFESICPCPERQPCLHTATLLLLNLTGSLTKPGPSPELSAWLDKFRVGSKSKPKPVPTPSRDALYYRLISLTVTPFWLMQLLKCTTRKPGTPGVFQEWNFSDRALLNPPKFIHEEDLNIIRLLRNHSRYVGVQTARLTGYPLSGEWGSEIIRRALTQERLVMAEPHSKGISQYPALTQGPARSGLLEWRRNADGRIVPFINTLEPGDVVIPVDPPWFLDQTHWQMGVLNLPFSSSFLDQLMSIPPLAEHELPTVATVLAEVAPEIPVPVETRVRVVDVEPQAVLSLGTLTDVMLLGWQSYRYGERTLDHASLSYRYDDMELNVDSSSDFYTRPDGETVQIKRKLSTEKAYAAKLKDLGFLKIPQTVIYRPFTNHTSGILYGLDREAAWPEFMRRDVPALRSAGWEVWIPSDFRHRYLEVEAFEAELSEQAGWFDLDLGIVVDGRRLPLAPLIHDLFRQDPRWTHQDKIEQIPNEEPVILLTTHGDRLIVPAQRLKPLARMLVDLFDAPPSDLLRFSRFDAPRLVELADMSRWEFKGMEALSELARKLQNTQGIHTISPPQDFALQLRPYQLEGLAWLQFLREQKLSGILADDMGLGKTAQALAHLLLEKQSGRMDLPSLVVMPTSLIYNWRREAEKFAPSLKVLSLQGDERKQSFSTIAESDVVLTTYPLLWRDAEYLIGHEYHLLILDEAQTVKNVTSQAAQVVRKLKSRHRLCLTGTPLENHLGELWAQFDFLLPGFLKDSKTFTSTWRTPIEKHGDKLRSTLLARRIKPFILRRRKEDVAKELPEKTIIIKSVELEGGQRDLYEAVRTAMNEKVRLAIAEQGFAKSQIIILDALLKLRQVCCDPRLVKIPSAASVQERAKLDLLIDMVPELVNEGRRILIFSQFTSMLSLIEAELQKCNLNYVQLTGETRDREGVIRRFQEDGVPIFLISLKAGGVGLNLTAADTVIHYDPWWNPAVENQATDRAHRIGQTRQVFVYKLVVAGSIEEKILTLQDKKAELAASVLSEDTQALAKFGESDINALLEPLPAK